LAKIEGVDIDMTAVQTNIVAFGVRGLGITSDQFVAKIKEKGVLCGTADTFRVRMVTHRGIVKDDVMKTLLCVQEVVQGR
jgi:threonine aldolase